MRLLSATARLEPSKPPDWFPALAARALLFEHLSEVRKLTTFHLAKNDHRWVTFISLKTITDGSPARSSSAPRSP